MPSPGTRARTRHPRPPPPHSSSLSTDPTTSTLLGCATLLVERKFLRGCGAAGHIEDVVVDERARGKKLGARLVAVACEAAREAGCYKVILDCSEANAPFYEKCGLTRKEVQMVRYF